MGRNTTQPKNIQLSAWTVKCFSKPNPPMYALRSNIFQRLHSLHKAGSFCTVPLYKGVQHFFERNISYKVILKETYSYAKFF
jgi:hypothetical protein